MTQRNGKRKNFQQHGTGGRNGGNSKKQKSGGSAVKLSRGGAARCHCCGDEIRNYVNFKDLTERQQKKWLCIPVLRSLRKKSDRMCESCWGICEGT